MFKLLALVTVAAAMTACQHAPWSLQGNGVRVDEPKAAKMPTKADVDEPVTTTFRVTFTPMDPTNATAIYFVVDTSGMDWWPGHCGPESGYTGCPDYVSMFGQEQQLQGLTSEGDHMLTTYRSDGHPDGGELFIFTSESGTQRFEQAKAALKDGVVYIQIRTHQSPSSITMRLFIGTAPAAKK